MIEIFNQIRGLNSYPGAYAIFNNKILKIWKSRIGSEKKGTIGEIVNIYDDGFGVICADGEIILTEVQLENKKKQTAREFINGHQLIGSILK